MAQDDPERRIAELERQLAERKPGAGSEHLGNRTVVTAEDVHNVAFSRSVGGKPGYSEDEVDRYLVRVEATLRDPATRDGVTPADVHNVAFSRPARGRPGYNEDEVDAFLRRVEEQLKSQQGGVPPATESREPTRCLLYKLGSRDQTTPVLAIDVGQDAIRVIDLSSNALIASGPLAPVTAQPAQDGGIPVLVVGSPGLQTLTIRAHPGPGTWRTRQKSKKPAYYATDAEWLTLAEKFGLASDLVDEYTPQTFLDHFRLFIDEFRASIGRTTWRTHLVLGLLFLVTGCISLNIVLLVIGVILLILAVLAWRFGWEW